MKLVGTDKVVAKLLGARTKMATKAEIGVTKAALWLKGESVHLVPVATGNLRASAFITTKSFHEGVSTKEQIDSSATAYALNLVMSAPIDSVTGVVSYAAVYALSVHENPKAGLQGHRNTKGKRIQWANTGRYKYLEEPLKRGEATILRILSKEAGSVKL